MTTSTRHTIIFKLPVQGSKIEVHAAYNCVDGGTINVIDAYQISGAILDPCVTLRDRVQAYFDSKEGHPIAVQHAHSQSPDIWSDWE